MHPKETSSYEEHKKILNDRAHWSNLPESAPSKHAKSIIGSPKQLQFLFASHSVGKKQLAKLVMNYTLSQNRDFFDSGETCFQLVQGLAPNSTVMCRNI